MYSQRTNDFMISKYKDLTCNTIHLGSGAIY